MKVSNLYRYIVLIYTIYTYTVYTDTVQNSCVDIVLVNKISD